jgi:colicin import membrane protein
MNTAPSLALVPADEPIPHPVQPYVEANPGSVLLYPKVREAFLAEIKAEIEAFEPDLSTRTSRAEIASLAFKVAKTKAPIEAAAKSLTEDFRKRTAAVNAERKDVLDKLDALRDLARAPLDKWEDEEKQRQDHLKEVFGFLDDSVRILVTDTSAIIAARIASVSEIEDNDDFHDARQRTLETLKVAYERLVKDEADRAELAELRAMQAERQRQDDDRARVEAKKLAEERRAADAKEEAARAEKAMQDRIEAAMRKIEEEAIATERRRADEAAAEAKRAADAEISKLAAEKQEMERADAARVAEAKRLAAEELARHKDRKHRAEVMTAAKEAIMRAAGIDETTAANIVKAIAAGKIPNVSIKF